MTAELRPPPAATPPLNLPEPAQARPADDKPVPPPRRTKAPPAKPLPAGSSPSPSTPAPAANWQQAVRQHLRRLDAAGQFYPREAIARGLQGEVLVLMVLDERGKVVAARVEQSCGQPILDDAALRAVLALTSLPADAPRQVLLPVRFRLR